MFPFSYYLLQCSLWSLWPGQIRIPLWPKSGAFPELMRKLFLVALKSSFIHVRPPSHMLPPGECVHDAVRSNSFHDKSRPYDRLDSDLRISVCIWQEENGICSGLLRMLPIANGCFLLAPFLGLLPGLCVGVSEYLLQEGKMFYVRVAPLLWCSQ